MAYGLGGCKELYMTEHTHTLILIPTLAQNLRNGILFYLHEFQFSSVLSLSCV